MLRWAKVLFPVVFLLALAIVNSSPALVHGFNGSCSASTSLNEVTASSTPTFQIIINNTGDTSLGWIRITHPSADFNFSSNTDSGWSDYGNPVYAYETNGLLDPGTSTVVTVNAQISNTVADAANWIVEVSDDGGNNISQCSGDLGTSIVADNAPNIINIVIADLRSKNAIINWVTDKPSSSQVNYGLDDSYGSSVVASSTPTTSHTVEISGLSPGTAYHYQVVSTDQEGRSTSSDDNTFITPTADVVDSGVAGTPSSSLSNSSSSSNSGTLSNFGVTIKVVPTEHVPPTIALATSFAKPFKQAPNIAGAAADNEAVAVIEYSTDGGQDWLPVDTVKGIGTKATTFGFTPEGLDDGNYSVMARAIDTSGNIGETSVATMVIDRLDPYTGGNLLSIGPQMLAPNDRGHIISSTGIDQKLTLSAVGGSTNIIVGALPAGSHKRVQSFTLTKSTDTSLWSGIVSFSEPGKYDLVASAVDGAGNKTIQTLSTVDVVSPTYTYNQSTKKPVTSNVTLYYLEPISQSWVVWDGSGYGQKNPQQSDKNGHFKLFVPPGKYYLKATAAGYETTVSSIFEINKSEPLATNLSMKPLWELSLGPIHLSFPTLAVQNINLNQQADSGLAMQSKLIGHPLPDFSLTNTNGTAVHAADLLGKPTLITLGASWSPTMSEQLATLNQLQANKDLNIVPVALQENAGKVRAYSSIAGLDLNWLVDPDSTLSQSYGSPSLPTHYFVDRKGIVKQVYVGILNQKQIIDILSGL